MDKAIILSGGMDSATLLWDLLHGANARGGDIHAITFDYGQRHSKEIIMAGKLVNLANEESNNFGEFNGGEHIKILHKIITIPNFDEIAIGSSQTDNSVEVPEGHYAAENMKKTVVPNRNMIMLSLAASYCFARNINKLYYGAHAGDHDIYPDCRPEFVACMSGVLKLADWNKLDLEAPYLNKDKGDIAIQGCTNGTPYEYTWTCYKGREKACGKCGACQERLEAFEKAGIKDPIAYV